MAPFVAREPEIARLSSLLDHVLGGQTRICFLQGAPGAGKTTLIQAFTAAAEARHPDLVAATGSCDAHTGTGDPYLPFLEVFAQITGNVETKLHQGTISESNAGRLRRFAQTTASVLLDVAPDLIGTFIPASSLIVRAIQVSAERSGLAQKVSHLLDTSPLAAPVAQVDQTRIVESYTAVIKELSKRFPLILVLDDLQWADAASCSLLFRLAQNLRDNRVLLIGTLRPNDVALARGGERHPLVPVLNELKRYHGDILIDLDIGDEARRRAFVSALVDSEPNRLGSPFREALYRHTAGHPLFTVELLRDLQDRGAIKRDDGGAWIAAGDLDWSRLPERIEGVIEERIGRLEDKLRDLLRSASVEGEKFTVEILARIQEISDRELLKTLSDQLAKRHQLVAEGEVEKIGRKWISHFVFTHALFQQYLYNDLSQRERMILHATVAELLEQFYEGRLELVVTHLARHYRLAGEDEKAYVYVMQSAQRALRIGAFVEALEHLDAALELISAFPEAQQSTRELDVQVGRAAAVKATKGWDSPAVVAIYARCRELTSRAGPNPQMAPILFGLWAMNLFHLHADKAWSIAVECLELGQKLGSNEVMLQARVAQANTRFWMGDFTATLDLTMEAEKLATDDDYAERHGQDPRAIMLMFAMFSSWIIGKQELARQKRQELTDLIARVSHTFTTAIALQATAWQSCIEHDPEPALADSARLIEVSAKNSFPFFAGIGRLFHGWATTLGGGDGLKEAEEGNTMLTEFGGRMLDSLFAVIVGECCLARRDWQRGLRTVDEAIEAATACGYGAYVAELHRLRGELRTASGDLAGGEANLREAMSIADRQQAVAYRQRAQDALDRLSAARIPTAS